MVSDFLMRRKILEYRGMIIYRGVNGELRAKEGKSNVYQRWSYCSIHENDILGQEECVDCWKIEQDDRLRRREARKDASQRIREFKEKAPELIRLIEQRENITQKIKLLRGVRRDG